MKYLKYFEQASAYETYKNGSDYILPNVSYIVETEDVAFTAPIAIPSDYEVFKVREGEFIDSCGNKLYVKTK